MKAQKGFTLIELVVVIVILGILAATAIPKFVDLSSEAGNAAAAGAAGAISSASALNYAKYKASGGTAPVTINGTPTCNMTTYNSLLTTALDTNKFVASGTNTTACGSGVVITACTLSYSATNATAYSVPLTCTM